MCHQVKEIEDIWRAQPATFIKSCCFEELINSGTSTKDSVFTLLQKFIDGKVYSIENLMKNPFAV